MTVGSLAELFAPFVDWPYLEREQKRRILTSLGTSIRAADYQVESLV